MATRNKSLTRIQLQYLRDQYQVLTDSDLTKAFNRKFPHAARSFTAIRSAIRNHRITCGGKGSNKKKSWQCTLMSEKQFLWLKANYVDISVKEITQQFNWRYHKKLTIGQMKTFISNRNLISGRSGYKNGNRPWNTGTKGVIKPNSGNFKPGPRPHLRSAIGTERVDKDGYIWIKVDMINPHTGVQGHYLLKHKVIWEAANGPTPPNHIVTFIDFNRANCVLENLEMISRGEQARRNKLQYSQAPAELRPSIKALARLQHVTGARSRQ